MFAPPINPQNSYLLHCIDLYISQPITTMPNLYVAMYEPADGIYEHWALYLQTDSQDTTYEVIGHPCDYTSRVLLKHPSATTRHKRSVFLYSIRAADIPEFERVLSTLTPANSPRSWNCQSYVLDVLNALGEHGVIDKDDVAYMEAKNRLVSEHLGPSETLSLLNVKRVGV